jgi:hypothetical protein
MTLNYYIYIYYMQSNTSMYGVVNGLYRCNIKRDNELNERISDRNLPSHELKPNLSFRPVLTKYALMPIVMNSNPTSVPVKTYQNYSQEKIFNPGSAAPWYGYANNVHLESSLRHQFYGLQSADQAVYVPSSTSDLFNVNINPNQEAVAHQKLFNKESFNSFNPNEHNLGNKLWNNHTKQDILDI